MAKRKGRQSNVDVGRLHVPPEKRWHKRQFPDAYKNEPLSTWDDFHMATGMDPTNVLRCRPSAETLVRDFLNAVRGRDIPKRIAAERWIGFVAEYLFMQRILPPPPQSR